MKKRSNRSASVLSRCLEPLESRVLLTATNHLAFITQPTDTAAGGTIDPSVVVAVEDSSNKVVTSDSSNVTISIDSGTGPDGASLGGTLTVAASDGLATFDDLSLTVAGSGDNAYKLTAKDGSYTSANSSSFNITPAAASKLVFDQGPSNVKAGVADSPAVTVDVEDKYGNIVTSDFSPVSLSVATGPSRLPPTKAGSKKVNDTPIPAKLEGTVIVSADSGVATFSDLVLDLSGAYTLAAADGKLTAGTSSSFTVSAGTATQVAFGMGPAVGTAGALAAITAQVEDKFGNVVTTDTSNVSIDIQTGPDGANFSGTPTKKASAGISTFSDLEFDTAGAYTLVITDASLTSAISSSFTLTAGAAAKLKFKQAPSATTAGVALAPAVSVMVEDQFGNLVPTDASTVTIAIGTGPNGAVLGGKATAVAVKGIATFPGLTLNTSGSYKLAISDASLTGANSDTFAVSPQAAVKLAYSVAPTDAVAGVKISPAIVVYVEDKFGNVVTGDSSTVTLGIGVGTKGATLGGTTSLSATAGVATFDSIKINTAGKCTLIGTDAKLVAATAAAFNITAAAASQVVLSTLPASVVAGATIPAVTASVEDQFGNVITGDTSSVTIAISSGTGPDGATLGGTLTEAAVAGVATFSDLSLTATDAGATAYKLKATDADLTAGVSTSFDVNAAVASQLIYKKGPTAAKAGATISPAITVQVEDKYGNIVTTDKSNVSLVISTGPSHTAPKKVGKKVSAVQVGATLSGTPTVAAVAGVATFNNLSLNFSGSYALTATDAKLTAATSDTFAISPNSATQVVFGTNPTAAVAGATLAGITAQVEDAYGNVVTTDTSKVTVAIATGPGSATLGGTLKETAVAGIATFSDLALQTAGTYTLGATDSALTAGTSTSFVISPAVASQLVGKQAPNSFVAGVAITPAATMAVEDQYGNVVTTDKSKVTAAISTGPDGAALTGVASATAVAGIATFSGLVLNTAGTYKLGFSDGSLTPLSTDNFTVVAAAPVKLAFGQAPAGAAAGAKQSSAVTVNVEDKFGNVVTGDNSPVVITFGTTPAGGPVGNLASFHASLGVATFSKLAFNLAGNYSIRASDGALTAAVSSPFAIAPAAAAKLAFVQNPSAEVAGVKVGPSLTVQVQDKYGNPVSTDTSNVTMAITDGTGPDGVSLGGTLTQAAAKGLASFGDLTLNTVGRYRLTASDASLTSTISNPFSVSPAAASQVVFDRGPTDTVAGSTTSPNVTVDVEDKFGNLVTSDSKSKVTVAIAGPTGAKMLGTLTQTAVSGVATFNDLSPQTAGASTIKATDAKLVADTSDSFNVSPGTASQLVFGTAPAATDKAGATFSAVTVHVEDALGNIVTGDSSKVTLALASGPDGVTPGGTLKENANSGIATFSDLAIQTAGAYTINATDSSLTNVTSGTVTITPATASQIAIDQVPTAATAGVVISPTMTADVEDQYGNVVTTDTSKVTLAISTGPTGAAITGTAIATAAKGVATFTGISLKTAGDYKLSFSDNSLTAATSSKFTIAPAAAAKLAFGQAPTAASATHKLSPSVTVDVEDQFGNIVTGDTSGVTLSIVTGATGATLGGTLMQSAISGVSTFDDLTLDKAGTYTLKAADASLTALTSSGFVISA